MGRVSSKTGHAPKTLQQRLIQAEGVIDTLRHQVAFFDGVWHHAPDNMFIIRLEEGEFITEAINPTLEHNFHVRAAEVVDLPLREAMPPAYAESISTHCLACIEQGEPLIYEEESSTLDGTLRYWSTLLVPILDVESGQHRIYGAARDLTRLRQTERELREAKEELEARVAERTRKLESTNALLQQMATHDALTGCFNRHHFFDVAEREYALAVRHQQPLSVIMLDADHFKQINDTHGHLIGDQALRCIADTCHLTLRATDILARYGGEEFVVLLPNTDQEGAFQIAERIRLQVENTQMKTEAGAINCTISLGVATCSPECCYNDLKPLLQVADDALLRAKREGRNRVYRQA